MTGDHGIEGAAGDGGQPVDVEIDVEVGFGTTGEAGKLRPVFVAAPCHRTVGIADARAWSDGKRLVTRTNLEDVARERPPDDAARVLSHGGQTNIPGSAIDRKVTQTAAWRARRSHTAESHPGSARPPRSALA